MSVAVLMSISMVVSLVMICLVMSMVGRALFNEEENKKQTMR